MNYSLQKKESKKMCVCNTSTHTFSYFICIQCIYYIDSLSHVVYSFHMLFTNLLIIILYIDRNYVINNIYENNFFYDCL